MIAVCFARHGMREGHLELVQSLQQQALALVLQVVERGLGGDQVWVTNDWANKETIIANLAITWHLLRLRVNWSILFASFINAYVDSNIRNLKLPVMTVVFDIA